MKRDLKLDQQFSTSLYSYKEIYDKSENKDEDIPTQNLKIRQKCSSQ